MLGGGREGGGGETGSYFCKENLISEKFEVLVCWVQEKI